MQWEKSALLFVAIDTGILLLVFLQILSHVHLFRYDLLFGTPEYQDDYRKTSSISHTKSQSLNVSCILAQLSSLKARC